MLKTKSEYSPTYKRFKASEDKKNTGLGLVDDPIDDDNEEGEAEMEEKDLSNQEMSEEGENEQSE